MSENISNFVTGLNTFFIGVVVVFSMLVLLIFTIVILGKVMQALTKKPEAPEVAVKEEVQVTKEEVAAVVEEKKQDDLELVAVITAVIAASMGTTSDKLQVRSLRKVERKSL